jgi:hypothetical protein
MGHWPVVGPVAVVVSTTVFIIGAPVHAVGNVLSKQKEDYVNL